MSAVMPLFADLPTSRRVPYGVTETQTLVGDIETRRTWNGRTRVLAPSWGAKYALQIAAEGDSVRLPPMNDLQPGKPLTVHSSVWWCARLPAGSTTAILLRDPVPGSVHARDADDDRIELLEGVAGRIVTIMNRGRESMIWYRPVLHCLVSRFETSGSATGKSQGWTLEVEEEFAP